MKKSILLLSVLTAAITANAETYKIPVGEFNELVVNDKLEVFYSANPDSVGFVVFDTKPEYASYIMTDSNKGKLRIQLDQAAIGLPDLPKIYVYSTFLSKAENWRDGNLYIQDIKPSSKITVANQGNGKIIANGLDAVSIVLKAQSGKGSIIASGKCRSLEIANVGSGTVEADGIAADEVDCRLMGTGTIGCAPAKKLKISGLGTGKVYYKGNPQINKSKLSNIKPIKIEECPEKAEEATVSDDSATTEDDGIKSDRTPVTPDDENAETSDDEGLNKI